MTRPPLNEDYDVWVEQRQFRRDLARETEELPDVSSDREPWTPDNRPPGSLWRSGRGSHAYTQDDWSET